MNKVQGQSILELLRQHSRILAKLRALGVIRTSNSPVSGYAEWLVEKKLGYKLATNSEKGMDARGPDGRRYQVKARHLTKENASRQLGVIRDLDKKQFDYLIAIYFNNDYTIASAFQVPHSVIQDYAKHSKHQNGHILHIHGAITSDKRVRVITDKFKD